MRKQLKLNEKIIFITKSILFLLFVGVVFFGNASVKAVESQDPKVFPATLNHSVTVRKKPVAKGYELKVSGKYVKLKDNNSVEVISQKIIGTGKYYKIRFVYNKKTYKGYIKSKYANISLEYDVIGKVVKCTDSIKVWSVTTKEDGIIQKENNIDSLKLNKKFRIKGEYRDAKGSPWFLVSYTSGSSRKTGYIKAIHTKLLNRDLSTGSSSGIDFESYMTEQGFPESYKPYLRTVHKQHPSWVFKAYQTNLDWKKAVTEEGKNQRCLISKSKKGSGWFSYAAADYSYLTDTFTGYDSGNAWAAPSSAAISYYMDPRNFITQQGIFQFESLEYQAEYQTVSGVKSIINNTPMASKKFTYTNTSGKKATMYYHDAFMKAAKASKVSPFHLASRVKQEVVKSSTQFSNSATGTYSGYAGYYNFYNIGATGTNAIVNGLKYAKGTNATYMLPWTDPYRAIVGGAIFISNGYISRGQNTIYLEKFDVTPYQTYNHQYMQNVEAANSEGIKTYNAYSGMMSEPLVFIIPVYNNMPAAVCEAPSDGANPNNWLKTLSLKNGATEIKTGFSASKGAGQTLSAKVATSVKTLTLSTACASSKATMVINYVTGGKTSKITLKNGSATLNVNSGSNILKITVTAENKAKTDYTVTITK
ncbi:MAG: cadherin-like beta sandwich domain-containing protein [Lachnospiraceae bacterium]|nr:cadherin-like beta sandwich domain-containing protein [Lachnospiraceae bacterium]